MFMLYFLGRCALGLPPPAKTGILALGANVLQIHGFAVEYAGERGFEAGFAVRSPYACRLPGAYLYQKFLIVGIEVYAGNGEPEKIPV